MAITYPLNSPDTIGIESITLRAVNSTTTSVSPFTYKQQVISFSGQRWEVDVTIPSVHRDLSAEWVAMLIALKGQIGTFKLGDPDYATNRGNCSSCVVTGDAGDDTVNVEMTGTLKVGDYIQLGSSAMPRLHKVLIEQTGDGQLEIWPALREDYSSEVAKLTDTKGTFRLASNVSEWSINNSSVYGISFSAVEVLQ
jgi:hypothetical protein